MKFLKMRLPALFILSAFMIKANSQVVTVEEIIMINNTAKAAFVTEFLKEKGFEYNAYGKDDSWVFRPFIDKRELISFFVIKFSDSLGRSKVTLQLYNAQDYKNFVDNLLKSNFRFSGMIARGRSNPAKADKMEYKSYLHFKKKAMSFFTRETIGLGNAVFYEIIFEQDKDMNQRRL